MKMLDLDLAELMARAKAFGCATSLDTDWDIYGNWMRKIEARPRQDRLPHHERGGGGHAQRPGGPRRRRPASS